MKIPKKIKLWWWKKTHVIEPIKITDTCKVKSISVLKVYNTRRFHDLSNEELEDDLAYEIGKSALKYTNVVFIKDPFYDTIAVKAQVKVVAR